MLGFRDGRIVTTSQSDAFYFVDTIPTAFGPFDWWNVIASPVVSQYTCKTVRKVIIRFNMQPCAK